MLTFARDGSAVEIVGLSWSAVSGLAGLGPGVYSHQQVPVFGSLAAWADRIRDNFDKYFWIGSKSGAQVRRVNTVLSVFRNFKH